MAVPVVTHRGRTPRRDSANISDPSLPVGRRRPWRLQSSRFRPDCGGRADMIESKRKTNGGSEPRTISFNVRQWTTSNRGRRGRYVFTMAGRERLRANQSSRCNWTGPQPKQNLRFCDGPSSRSYDTLQVHSASQSLQPRHSLRSINQHHKIFLDSTRHHTPRLDSTPNDTDTYTHPSSAP
jgi:hypothetical protein